MTVKELMEILKDADPDMEVTVCAPDSTGEYCDADEMTDENIHIGDERIVIVAD